VVDRFLGFVAEHLSLERRACMRGDARSWRSGGARNNCPNQTIRRAARATAPRGVGLSRGGRSFGADGSRWGHFLAVRDTSEANYRPSREDAPPPGSSFDDEDTPRRTARRPNPDVTRADAKLEDVTESGKGAPRRGRRRGVGAASIGRVEGLVVNRSARSRQARRSADGVRGALRRVAEAPARTSRILRPVEASERAAARMVTTRRDDMTDAERDRAPRRWLARPPGLSRL
jgi:hypothetical protein